MKIDAHASIPADANLIIATFFEESKDNLNAYVDTLSQKGLSSPLILSKIQSRVSTKAFTGKEGQTLLITFNQKDLYLVGLGKKADLDNEVWKNFAANTIKFAIKYRFSHPVFIITDHYSDESLYNLCLGIHIGNYSFTTYKTKDKEEHFSLEHASVMSSENGIIAKANIVGKSISFTRTLGNTPSNDMTPTIIADNAVTWSKEMGFGIEVFDEDKIRSLKMNSFLAVSQGSAQPPKFLVMHHNPASKKSSKKIALVGKGISFDTGGISLKPSDKMDEMKFDMSGAGTVIGAMGAISQLNLPMEVYGIVATCENMPGGKAIKPGDVVTASNGKTIEILNTDAEGRLILADALTYASNLDVDYIIDMATLTGACVIALGEITSGILGTSDDLIQKIIACGKSVSENIWQLPLFDKYSEQLKSPVADVKNIGGRAAGTITATAFLKEFVDPKVNWAHLDIAGTAWTTSEGIFGIGATGVPLATIVQTVEALSNG